MLAIKKCTVIIILKEFVCIDINVSYGIARHLGVNLILE